MRRSGDLFAEAIMADFRHKDQVVRKARWLADHPGWKITPPGGSRPTRAPRWKGTSPDGAVEVWEYDLEDLLDRLETLT